MRTFDLLRAVDRIAPETLAHGPAALLALLVRRQRRDGWHFATGAALAAALKASRRSVCRWLAVLRRCGVVRVWRRFRRGPEGVQALASGFRVSGFEVERLASGGHALRAAEVAARTVRRAVLAGAVRACATMTHKIQPRDLERRLSDVWRKIGSEKYKGDDLAALWRLAETLEAAR